MLEIDVRLTADKQVKMLLCKGCRTINLKITKTLRPGL